MDIHLGKMRFWGRKKVKQKCFVKWNKFPFDIIGTFHFHLEVTRRFEMAFSEYNI